MDTNNKRWRCTVLLLLAISFDSARLATAQTNTVSAGNTIDYTINGSADPGFTFQRGVTYVFVLNNVLGHPFWIKSVLGGNFSGGAGAFSTGVINNGAQSGSVVFTVPASAPDQLFYQCGNHGAMSGILTIVTPPSPPTVRIVFVDVGNFITIKSSGTNGWSAVPEFRCGSGETNWTALATGQFTNSFVSGTNTTTFPRLDPICGSSNVLVRIRNQQP